MRSMRIAGVLIVFTVVAVCLGAEDGSVGDGLDRFPENPFAFKKSVYDGKTLREWVELAKTGDRESLISAARALGGVQSPLPEAKAIVPGLIQLLDDKNEVVQLAAIQALGTIGPDAKSAVSALSGFLADQGFSDMKRRSAVLSLGRIGPAAKTAIPQLTELLSDEADLIRSYAARALGRIGPEAKSAVPKLIELLADEDESVRFEAADGLGGIGPDARTAVPKLIDLVADKDKVVRSGAAYGLRGIGPDARAAVPKLIELLGDEDTNVRWAAASALEEIGLAEKMAVSSLIELLQHKESGTRFQALSLLVKSKAPVQGKQGAGNAGGWNADQAVPLLLKLLEDEPHIQFGALLELGSFDSLDRVPVSVFIRLLESEDSRLRSVACTFVTHLKDGGKATVPTLCKLLQSEDDTRGIRRTAAQALGGIGPEAKEAVPELMKLFEDEDRRVCATAIQALGRIGPEAKEAIPALTKLANDPNNDVRQAAFISLILIKREQ